MYTSYSLILTPNPPSGITKQTRKKSIFHAVDPLLLLLLLLNGIFHVTLYPFFSRLQSSCKRGFSTHQNHETQRSFCAHQNHETHHTTKIISMAEEEACMSSSLAEKASYVCFVGREKISKQTNK